MRVRNILRNNLRIIHLLRVSNLRSYRANTLVESSGTTNHRGTRKLDNTLKGIWNIIAWNLDNPCKGIWELVTNGIRIKWPRGLTVPT